MDNPITATSHSDAVDPTLSNTAANAALPSPPVDDTCTAKDDASDGLSSFLSNLSLVNSQNETKSMETPPDSQPRAYRPLPTPPVKKSSTVSPPISTSTAAVAATSAAAPLPTEAQAISSSNAAVNIPVSSQQTASSSVTNLPPASTIYCAPVSPGTSTVLSPAQPVANSGLPQQPATAPPYSYYQLVQTPNGPQYIPIGTPVYGTAPLTTSSVANNQTMTKESVNHVLTSNPAFTSTTEKTPILSTETINNNLPSTNPDTTTSRSVQVVTTAHPQFNTANVVASSSSSSPAIAGTTNPYLMQSANTLPVTMTTGATPMVIYTSGMASSSSPALVYPSTGAVSAATMGSAQPVMMSHAATMPVTHATQMGQVVASTASINTVSSGVTVPGLLPKGQTNTTTMFTNTATTAQLVNGQVVGGQVVNGQVVGGQVVNGQVVGGQVMGGHLVINGQVVGKQVMGGTLQEQTAYMPITGKRRALLIGIDYCHTPQFKREGSHQAVLEMYDFLVKHCGYKSADVLILSDRQSKQQLYPTRNTIIKACEWLLKEAAPGDSFVFYYAGRSSMVPDHNNEQVNNMCTALVPMDHNVAGLLISSDMNTLLVQPIPLGARLLILNDITTPGSICALPNIYKTDGSKRGILSNTSGLGSIALKMGMGMMLGQDTLIAQGLGMGAGRAVKTAYTQSRGQSNRGTQALVVAISRKQAKAAGGTPVQVPPPAPGALGRLFIELYTYNPVLSYEQLRVGLFSQLTGRHGHRPEFSAGSDIPWRAPIVI